MTRAQRRARQRATLAMQGPRAFGGGRFAEAGQFAGAKERPNTRGWGPRAQSPNADTVGDQKSLRARGRDAERNFALAASAMITFDTCVIGTGLRPMPRIDFAYLGLTQEAAAELSSTFLRHYTLWATSPFSSFDQSATFGQQQRGSLASRLLNGDHWIVFRFDAPGPYGFALQHIEADLVRTPPRGTPDSRSIIDGVEFNGNGVAEAIHVAPGYPDDQTVSQDPAKWVRIPMYVGSTRVVLHQVAGRRRSGQARGTSIFAPVLEDLKGVTDFSESALTTAINDSIFTGIFKTPRGSTLLQNTMLTARDPETGALIATTIDAGGLPKPPKLGSGNSVSMYDDETYEAVESKRPSPQFDPFWSSGVKRVGAGIGLPPELILRAFTASFSASKGAVNEGFRTIYSIRGDEVTNLAQPTYDMFWMVLQLRGVLRLPKWNDLLARAAYTKCMWSGPIPGSMNPLDEARAAEIRLNNFISTHEEETADYSGESWDANHDQQVKEWTKQRADGLRAALVVANPSSAAAPDDERSQVTRDEQARHAA